MKLLCLTDLHGNQKALARIAEAAAPVDLVLLGGDITNFGQPEEAEHLVGQLAQVGAEVLAVAGNCDSAAIEQRLIELGISVFRRGLVRRGIGFHGLSAMPPWRSDMYQFTEDELAEMLQEGAAQLEETDRRVVLSHAPPRNGKLDRTHLLKHVGSTALREYVDREQPELVVCGHIHEGRGTTTLGRTTVVNCGTADKGYYALIEMNEDPNRAPEVTLLRA